MDFIQNGIFNKIIYIQNNFLKKNEDFEKNLKNIFQIIYIFYYLNNRIYYWKNKEKYII